MAAATTFTFLTPAGGLLVLAVLLPLAGFALAERRTGAARALLGLAAPRGRSPRATILALVAVPALLALAAAQPALRRPDPLRVRTDAEAMFVLDTSRSMSAAERSGGPTRLSRAQAAATRIRAAIPGVPAGAGTLTDRVLPNLLPTADAATFDATVRDAIGIDRPPPQQIAVTATNLSALADVATQGFFAPSARRRLLVVLTDGESRPYSVAAVGRALRSGRGVSLVLVHVGGPGERVFRPSGRPEAAYVPHPDARQDLDRLAAATGGRVVDESELDEAEASVRTAIGSGPTVGRGLRPRITALAPYAAAACLVPLLFLLLPRGQARRRPLPVSAQEA